ncbi:MAG: hypothetical protein MKZ94_12840, partial [Pirellulales bacterium]|nr:hypothetical protein [Pirellulales bacterium]
MNTENQNTDPELTGAEVLLGRNASLATVLAILILVVASILLIDKRTQGINVGTQGELSANDHFRQAIEAMHTRHTPDVLMHRNSLQQ